MTVPLFIRVFKSALDLNDELKIEKYIFTLPLLATKLTSNEKIELFDFINQNLLKRNRYIYIHMIIK